MAILQADDIADLVIGTLKELGRLRFQQIAQTLQDYEVMAHWLKEDRVIFDDGYGINRTLMLKYGTNAKHVGLFSKDDTNVTDHLATLTVPWVHLTKSWAFEHRETLMNRGKSLVVNVIKPRRAGSMIAIAEELEEKAWSAPALADKHLPYGVMYWIVYNATTGFNGDVPSGHTTVGGINPTTFPNFKNYTANYTNVTKADLLVKLRSAFRLIHWKSPVSVKDFRGSQGERYRLYVNEATIVKIETVAEQQNENIGRDIAFYDGQTVFNKIPFRYVPGLDGKSGGPVFLIDHSVFHPAILRGDYLREGKPKEAFGQHNTFVVHVDLSYNYICVDRRRCALLATADPAA